MAFHFIVLSNLNAYLNSLTEILSVTVSLVDCFSQLIEVPKYFIDSFKSITVFFVRISSNKLRSKFLFYCFLSPYFIVNVSIYGYIDFYQFLLQLYSHENITSSIT